MIIDVQFDETFSTPESIKILKILRLIFFKRTLFNIFTAWLRLNSHITILQFSYLCQICFFLIPALILIRVLVSNFVHYYSLLRVIVFVKSGI